MALPESSIHSIALGNDARRIETRFAELRDGRALSITLGREEAIGQLVENFCKGVDWDGFDAAKPSIYSFLKGIEFLRGLPSRIKSPEVDFDPDGDVMFEWNEGPRRTFSVSIDRTGEISYAGLFGGSKVYGSEYFFGSIPKPIVDNLLRL